MAKDIKIEKIEHEVIPKSTEIQLSFHGRRREMKRRKIMSDFGYWLFGFGYLLKNMNQGLIIYQPLKIIVEVFILHAV